MTRVYTPVHMDTWTHGHRTGEVWAWLLSMNALLVTTHAEDDEGDLGTYKGNDNEVMCVLSCRE